MRSFAIDVTIDVAHTTSFTHEWMDHCVAQMIHPCQLVQFANQWNFELLVIFFFTKFGLTNLMGFRVLYKAILKKRFLKFEH